MISPAQMTRLPATTFDLGSLHLSHGEGRSIDLAVPVAGMEFGGQRYEASSSPADARLDISRTRTGHAMRIRFDLSVTGPCMRCLEPASLELGIDAREVDQPEDPETISPYVVEDDLDLGRWAHDAVALALPDQILCRTDCVGLCPVCGVSLNGADAADHVHEAGGDPRWAKLGELDLE